MNFPLAVIGLALIAFGIFMLINRDAMWTLTEWNNSMRGVKSERTDAWERGNGCTGALLILFGVGFIVFSLTAGSTN